MLRLSLSRHLTPLSSQRCSWRLSHHIRCIPRPFALPIRHTSTSHLRRKDLPTVDTIYALSSAPGRAAIAIIRISGPACLDIYGSLCPDRPFPVPRVATLRKLYSPSTHDGPRTILDSGALVLYLPSPQTVTGEDILELHVHGGPAIVRSVLSAIPNANARPRRRTSQYSTIRHAEPGEFTKRAFYNNRIALTEAESLGSLLAAETEQQRRLAVLGSESGLTQRYESWQQLLLHARGELEALIDFSEDQHFDESPAQFISSITTQIHHLQNQLRLHITNASKGELLRSGIRVALIGAPNAGKSSLLNRIVGREAAIVSAEEGTTRDIVDVSVDLDGWLVRLGDMAGLRSQSSPTPSKSHSTIGAIEAEGIRRAQSRALASDVVIVLLSLTPKAKTNTIDLQIPPTVLSTAQACAEAQKTLVVAVNKSDLLPDLTTSVATTTAMKRYILNALPTVVKDDVHFISCLPPPAESISASNNAASSQSSTHDASSTIQPFLQSLIQTFARITTAAINPSSAATSTASTEMSPAEAQVYWTASLTVTERQTAYLKECLAHLEDFLAQTSPPSAANNAESPSQSTKPAPLPQTTSEQSSHAAELLSEQSPAVENQGAMYIDLHSDLQGERHQDHTTPHRQATQTAIIETKTGADDGQVEEMEEEEEQEVDIVTAAEHLRHAAACLGKITGKGGEGGDVEDVLGVVFEKYVYPLSLFLYLSLRIWTILGCCCCYAIRCVASVGVLCLVVVRSFTMKINGHAGRFLGVSRTSGQLCLLVHGTR